MISKNTILLKVESLEEYCNNNRDSSITGNFASFILPLKTAVNTYFSSVSPLLQDDIRKMIPQLYNDIMMRYIDYEFEYGAPLPTNYPQGYNDFDQIFNGDGVFDSIMNISGETFLAGFPIVQDAPPAGGSGGTGGSGGSITYHYETNPIITTWVGFLSSAHESEVSKIEAITEFCERNGYNDGLISLFEDRGKMKLNITKEQIAARIYTDGHLKSVLESFGLNIYIPSYI